MRRPLMILLFLLLLCNSAFGQLWKTRRIEALAGLGTTQFFGDIGGFSQGENILGFKDIIFHQTRFNLSLGASYLVLRDVTVRLNLAYGMFHASDRKGSNELREMESRTSFFEPALLGEYYFIRSRAGSSYLFSRGRGQALRNIFESLDFYAFTGIGGLSYSVKGNEDLTTHPNFRSGGFTGVIPAGVGIKLLYNPDFNVGIEIGGRYAFSDYLDGYTSQYSRSKDVYYFLNATVTYRLATTTRGLPRFLR